MAQNQQKAATPNEIKSKEKNAHAKEKSKQVKRRVQKKHLKGESHEAKKPAEAKK